MLSIGKTYRLIFQSPWKEQYDVLIVGTTDVTDASTFGTFDIKGQLFDAYGLGIETYLSAVGQNAPIYICKKIQSRKPISVEEKPSLFIPSRIVDEIKTINLLETSDYVISLEGLRRSFTPLAELDFLETLKQNLRAKLLLVDELLSYPVSLTVDSTTALYEEPYLLQLEVNRMDAVDNLAKHISQKEVDENKRIQLINEKLKALDDKYVQENLLIKDLLLKLDEVSAQNNANILEAARLDFVTQAIVVAITLVNTANPGTLQEFAVYYAAAVIALQG